MNLSTNQTSPRKAPMVLLKSSSSNHKRVHSNLEFFFLQTFYQTPSVQTILVSVNRFSFLTLILSSSILSRAMHLPRTHIWHLISHSFHYHLVIWGHLQLVSIMFLRLINSLTIWLLSYAPLLTLLEFEIYGSKAILWPIPLALDPL
jgi:hypothetical protein